MRMRLAADLDPRPRVFLDRDTRSVNAWKVMSEVTRQPQRELLDLPDRRFLGEGVDGVFLRIGGYDVGVVALEVAAGEVSGERDADVDVLDLVHGTIWPT